MGTHVDVRGIAKIKKKSSSGVPSIRAFRVKAFRVTDTLDFLFSCKVVLQYKRKQSWHEGAECLGRTQTARRMPNTLQEGIEQSGMRRRDVGVGR